MERVACIEEGHGIYHRDWISLEDIEEVAESPFRLPAPLANRIYSAGEAGMGYCIFTLQLMNRPDIVCVTGSGLVDFPGLPEGVLSKDIIGAIPHAGRESTLTGDFFEPAEHGWCYFVSAEETQKRAGEGKRPADKN